jgi:hypothetical protein
LQQLALSRSIQFMRPTMRIDDVLKDITKEI